MATKTKKNASTSTSKVEEKKDLTIPKRTADIEKALDHVLVQKCTLDELKAYAEDACKVYEAYSLVADLKKAANAMETAQRFTEAYNKRQAEACFEYCLGDENPMKAAAVKFTYPVIKAVEVKIKDSTAKTLRIKDDDKVINPVQFARYAKREHEMVIGNDESWVYWLQMANYQLALLEAIKLGAEVKGDYAISDDTVKYFTNLGTYEKMVKGTVNTLAKSVYMTLQNLINAMVGKDMDSKMTKERFNYIIRASASVKRAGIVACVKDSKFSEHALWVCHNVLTNNGVTLQYQAKKG